MKWLAVVSLILLVGLVSGYTEIEEFKVNTTGNTTSVFYFGGGDYLTGIPTSEAIRSVYLNYSDSCSATEFYKWGTGCVSQIDISVDTNLAVSSPATLTGDTVGVQVLKDLVTSTPLTGGTDNILTGADSDVTLAITVLKDIVVSGTGMSGGADDVLTGSDGDVSVILTTNKDLVAGAGLSGGEDDVLVGSDADTTFSVDTTWAATFASINTGFGVSEVYPKGTLTNTYLCKYTSAGTVISCDVDPASFQPAGAVTSVTGTSPIVSSGGTTPAISATVAKDLVTTAPLTGSTDNVLLGVDSDLTIGIDVLKDIVTTAPITGGTDNVLTGSDSDLTIAITVEKDLVAGNGMSGGADDVLTGSDADVTVAVGAGDGIDVAADSVAVDVSDILAASKGVVEIATNNIGLRQDCGTGQHLESDSSDNWVCADDTDTTYSAGNGISLSTTTFSVAGNTALTQDADGLSVTADGIGDTQLAFDTGQLLSTSGIPTFAALTITNDVLADDVNATDDVYAGDDIKAVGSLIGANIDTGQGVGEIYPYGTLTNAKACIFDSGGSGTIVCNTDVASGTVTSVTGTSPIVSSEGTTPAISATIAKDLVTTAPLTGSTDDVLLGTDSDLTIGIDVAKDIVTTAPLTGGEDNVLTGSDADLTIALTLLKDITASGTGMSGGADNVLPGADGDVTITLTTSKDIVAGDGLAGGEDNVLPGADADTTLTLMDCAANQILQRNAGDDAWECAAAGAGTVTAVTGAAPITSTEGATPEIGVTVAKDIVTTSPLTVNGGASLDNVIIGSDADITIAPIILKDLVTTAPITGAVDNVFLGTDSDITLGWNTATADAISPDNLQDTGQTDEYCLTYEATGPTLEWAECGSGGSYDAGNGISLAGTTFSVAGNTALTQDADGLSVTADEITDTELEYNTGQHLTTTANVVHATVDATTDFTVDGLVLTADTISNDATLNVKPSGDADDFISFLVEDNYPTLAYTDAGANEILRIRGTENTNQKLELFMYDDGGSFFRLYSDDGKITSFVAQNATDTSFPELGYIYDTHDAGFGIISNGDTSDYLSFTSDGTNPGINVVGDGILYINSEATSIPLSVTMDNVGTETPAFSLMYDDGTYYQTRFYSEDAMDGDGSVNEFFAVVVPKTMGSGITKLKANRGDLLLSAYGDEIYFDSIGAADLVTHFRPNSGDTYDTTITVAASDGDTTIANGGDLTLDPAGNNVNPGSDSTDSLGATGVVWSEGWFDKIDSDGTTTLEGEAVQISAVGSGLDITFSANDKIIFKPDGVTSADGAHMLGGSGGTTFYPGTTGEGYLGASGNKWNTGYVLNAWNVGDLVFNYGSFNGTGGTNYRIIEAEKLTNNKSQGLMYVMNDKAVMWIEPNGKLHTTQEIDTNWAGISDLSFDENGGVYKNNEVVRYPVLGEGKDAHLPYDFIDDKTEYSGDDKLNKVLKKPKKEHTTTTSTSSTLKTTSTLITLGGTYPNCNNGYIASSTTATCIYVG